MFSDQNWMKKEEIQQYTGNRELKREQENRWKSWVLRQPVGDQASELHLHSRLIFVLNYFPDWILTQANRVFHPHPQVTPVLPYYHLLWILFFFFTDQKSAYLHVYTRFAWTRFKLFLSFATLVLIFFLHQAWFIQNRIDVPITEPL